MNKTAIITLLAAVTLSGCSHPHLSADTLQHHRYELVSIDGTVINAQNPQKPTLEFGENMHVSGKMCNRFNGQGQLADNVLTVKTMMSTRMLCADPQLNQGDMLLAEMLEKGAKVSLQAQKLTLTQGQHQLIYQLKELVN